MSTWKTFVLEALKVSNSKRLSAPMLNSRLERLEGEQSFGVARDVEAISSDSEFQSLNSEYV